MGVHDDYLLEAVVDKAPADLLQDIDEGPERESHGAREVHVVGRVSVADYGSYQHPRLLGDPE
jgi:hypothetical protein